MNFNLALPFYKSALQTPDAIAVHADDTAWTYQGFMDRVLALAEHFRRKGNSPRRVGILASRSADACVGILAAAWVGATYVPINLAVPESARIEIIERSKLDALIADMEGSVLLTPSVLSSCPPTIIAHSAHVQSSSTIVDWHSLKVPPEISAPVQVDGTQPAYILYTSGTTGIPKGVVIPASAVAHLVEKMQEHYPIFPEDRVAETTATSFDLSVYNMFAAWRGGASLHIIPSSQSLVPAKFIIEHAVTVWLSVPSVAMLLSRAKLLRANAFPSMRQTFFAGEPLLASMAAEWQVAAPNTRIFNLYGPTEATVVCIGQECRSDSVLTRDEIAIGAALPGTEAAIIDTDRRWQRDGEPGELIVSGPQLAVGYLDDPAKTDSKFVEIDGVLWYRTGDLAMRDASGMFHFLGRVDNQVKIMGFRVELEDVEFHLRKVSGCESVCAVAWPIRNGSAAGIIAFIEAPIADSSEIKEALRKHLPPYFVPSQIRSVSDLPVNANGKINRKALVESLRQETAKG